MDALNTTVVMYPDARTNEDSPISYLSMNYFVNYCIFLPFISLVGELTHFSLRFNRSKFKPVFPKLLTVSNVNYFFQVFLAVVSASL